MLVHFPIALLALGWWIGVASLHPRSPAWFKPAAPWTLIAGTLFLWLVLGLGLLAERYAPHVPAAWEVMADHKQHAYITAWIFTAVAAAQILTRDRVRGWILAAWALGLVSLVLTAHLGATLVFTYGLGSPPS
ncbi:MAG TPA: DUF2231 domain-containing protein [bacterium]|nr:DUF2231 domain-containing protein [bacterium]